MHFFSELIVWLYAASIIILSIYGLNLLVLSLIQAFRELTKTGLPSAGETGEPLGPDPPHVTIQLPIYNEAHVVRRIIDACARLSYPRHRFEIQILDDSDDETSGIIADCVRRWKHEGIDMVHVQRNSRDGFKAGALKHGTALAKGDLIAIFDADFVPQTSFLEQTIPHFNEPNVGMVQARWGHINEDHSLLTRIQAFGLDAHFALEQRVRSATDCFINFNGTAGVWRRTCIEDAGGWSSETLTEDLDLSYRAQLKGWKFVYKPDIEVPAELPVSMNAFRDQQFRWTKGALQTARKTLGPLWKSSHPPRVKWEGTIHLSAIAVFPALALAALCHPALIVIRESGHGPGPTYFGFLSVGMIGLVGFFLAQVIAQRSLYTDWAHRLWNFPLFMSGGIGMSLNNCRAFLDVILGRQTEFVRTPKHDVLSEVGRDLWLQSPYTKNQIPVIAYVEAIFALYSIIGLGYMIAVGAWTAIPFQIVFATGFLFVSGTNLVQFGRARSRPVGLASGRAIM
ncbi:MAG: glycosyltransferase [Bacteroidetes bacterium]|nr:MAG: glycosyltransferase [Bacteroidota bacterium]